MKLSFWYRARYWILLLLIILITLSSHPTIVRISKAAGLTSGTILSQYIIMVFLGLFVMCVNLKSMLIPKIVRLCWFVWFLIVFFFFISFSLFGERTMMDDMRSIAICIVAIMIGWQFNIDKRKIQTLLVVFACLTIFVGLMQVFVNVGGFVIQDLYETDNKNALGVMLATSCIVTVFLAINTQFKTMTKYVYFALTLIGILVLLTIRARAATLAVVIMLIFAFYESIKGKNFLFYALLAVVVVVCVFLVLPESVKQFVYNSFYQNYEGGDVTSGRTERNLFALQFLSQNMWFGNMNVKADFAQIHNYPLNRMCEFGLVFVFPIILLYLILLFYCIKKAFKANNHNIYNLGYYLLLIPFIISLAEPTFPFGPGTATVFNFLLFGMALRNSYNIKSNQMSQL